MSIVIERILKLAEEIANFPLQECLPSNDSEKESAYVINFVGIATRFIGSLKRISNESVKAEICLIDLDVLFITDTIRLKNKLLVIIDIINDLHSCGQLIIDEDVVVSPYAAAKLNSIIVDCLSSESANILPVLCSGYGLKDGDTEEAYKSKKSYIKSRIAHFTPNQSYDLALKIQGKYSGSELELVISDIRNNMICTNVTSEFDSIKQLITTEVESAKYLIWIAVAWFTDIELARALYKKKQEGVNVQIIINDDYINAGLVDKIKEHLDVYLICKEHHKLMHNKFCIVDLKNVVHGSYNWTNKAQYNNETISKIEDRAQAEKFADEFIRLKGYAKIT